MRSNNGTEFVNHTLREFYQTHGIIHQTTCSYSPQRNGVVERKHQHILQVARAILKNVHLPLKYWGESILIATKLINMLLVSK